MEVEGTERRRSSYRSKEEADINVDGPPRDPSRRRLTWQICGSLTPLEPRIRLRGMKILCEQLQGAKSPSGLMQHCAIYNYFIFNIFF